MSMVATPNGAGYMLFAPTATCSRSGFAKSTGSLPGIGSTCTRPGDVARSAGTGYVLVGADGGIFNFGKGVPFLG